MRWSPGPRQGQAGARAQRRTLRWEYLVPAVALVVIVIGALAIQPGGAPAASRVDMVFSSPTPGQPDALSTPTPGPTEVGSTIASPTAADQAVGAATALASEEVAGVITTPTTVQTDPTPDNVRSIEERSAQCGNVRESVSALSVEQTLAGVAVRATNAAVYPVDYFRCILLATGGGSAVNLANSVARAERQGATHALLVDLWVGNHASDFAQLHLREAEFAVSGQLFPALGVLNGRGELVLAAGQSRTLALVAMVNVAYGATTGPVTISFDAPAVGGSATAGKYQLFLPTP